ncbi:MAG TPA: hypothetical protein VMO88_02210, partial [Acidimicrobiales bacterium]|nr:hypothetical protein [Acidimicrobiales bacterium]
VGGQLVDMHGQHGHQALLTPTAQRAMLDRFGGISTGDVTTARRALKDLEASRDALGGDGKARAREMDLLRFQIEELETAGLDSPDEDERLNEEEETLGAATSLRESAEKVHAALTADEGICDRVGSLIPLVHAGKALAPLRDRLAATSVELADIAREARLAADSLEDDPERLAWIGARRQTLSDLRRKYGDTLAEVIAFRDAARERLAELGAHDKRAAGLDDEISAAAGELAEKERQLWERRTAVAPLFSEEVEKRLRELAMPRARFVVEVGDSPPGDSVTWMLGANPGEPVLPLTKVASGGELARTMLAARLTVGTAPFDAGQDGSGAATLVFDEVDAGVGGEAAVSVGRALAALAGEYQVLIVTHLPQVAAFANQHLVVEKRTQGDRTVASVEAVSGQDRVVELSRMLSGSPGSETARRHAEELLNARIITQERSRPAVK